MSRLWRIIQSVLASAFGVQSEANRQADFNQESFVPYILVGVVFVALFIAGLIALVNVITH
ncbi:DUF2970 domain-containing protein [Bowmanella sp. JS7-9]|uniref:DUF2970 domain-containing protein n=1 Tax=Pseudobowmanella zhangzhouensis TaxID=1537679 RepID=A0ABW1XGA3_9ALTE|nr:DUF2970 domain-containing protein [Bowmanella sp. JS7-9]TBX20772.1 membrane protein [Bowmanella sp. JS7-9]